MIYTVVSGIVAKFQVRKKGAGEPANDDQLLNKTNDQNESKGPTA